MIEGMRHVVRSIVDVLDSVVSSSWDVSVGLVNVQIGRSRRVTSVVFVFRMVEIVIQIYVSHVEVRTE